MCSFLRGSEEIETLPMYRSSSRKNLGEIRMPEKTTKNLFAIFILLFFSIGVFSMKIAEAQTLKERYEAEQANKRRIEQQQSMQRERNDAIMSRAFADGLWLNCDGLIRVFHQKIVWRGANNELSQPSRYTIKNDVIFWVDSLEQVSLELHLKTLTKYSSLALKMNLPPDKCRIIKGTFAAL